MAQVTGVACMGAGAGQRTFGAEECQEARGMRGGSAGRT